jgi:hypothetical protein
LSIACARIERLVAISAAFPLYHRDELRKSCGVYNLSGHVGCSADTDALYASGALRLDA